MSTVPQIMSARFVPQIGEIWKVIYPFWWRENLDASGIKGQLCRLQVGDQFMIEIIDHELEHFNRQAYIIWFGRRGRCPLAHISAYCVRVNTWNEDSDRSDLGNSGHPIKQILELPRGIVHEARN